MDEPMCRKSCTAYGLFKRDTFMTESLIGYIQIKDKA